MTKLDGDAAAAVAVSVALLVMGIAPVLMCLLLLARRTGIVARCGVALRRGRILVRLHPVLIGALLMPCRIVVAAYHHLCHRRRGHEKCSQTV
jgi:hypothetical protein